MLRGRSSPRSASVLRRHARRPAGLERRRVAADRQPRHRDPAERHRHRLANDFLAPGAAWILAAVCVALYAGVQLVSLRSRRGRPRRHPAVIVVVRVVGLAVALGVVVAVCNQNRGRSASPRWSSRSCSSCSGTCSTRTRWAPHLRGRRQRRGGAARRHQRRQRADRVLRAVLTAGRDRRRSSSPRACARWTTNTGGGQALLYPIAAAVIGGTSLFGGRGTMKAAILGALVMLSIDNGLGLLGLSSGTKFVLTGGVLLLAVTVDSISRRGRAQERQGMTGARCGSGSSRRPRSTTPSSPAPAIRGRRGSRRSPRATAAGAEAYAAEKGIPRAHGSYEALLADGTSRRSTSRCRTRCTCRGRSRRWRPASTCCARSRCRRARPTWRRRSTPPSAPGWILMEAFMWRYHPATEKVVSLVGDGAIGRLRGRARGVRLHARPGGRQRALVG